MNDKIVVNVNTAIDWEKILCDVVARFGLNVTDVVTYIKNNIMDYVVVTTE